MGVCLKCQELEDILENNKGKPEFYDIDRWRKEGWHDKGFRVFFNGDDVSNDTFAMSLGDNGFIARYVNNDEGMRHFCEGVDRFAPGAGEHGIASEVSYGKVEFVKTR